MKLFNFVVFVFLFVGLTQGLTSEELKKWKAEIKKEVFKDIFESEVMKNVQNNLNNVMTTTQEIVTQVQHQSSILDKFRHSIYIRTVSSYIASLTDYGDPIKA